MIRSVAVMGTIATIEIVEIPAQRSTAPSRGCTASRSAAAASTRRAS
jgi:hypothetical protein